MRLYQCIVATSSLTFYVSRCPNFGGLVGVFVICDIQRYGDAPVVLREREMALDVCAG